MNADELRALAEQVMLFPKRAATELTRQEGFRVTFDKYGDFRFWKWGNEFFCLTQRQVASALLARATQLQP